MAPEKLEALFRKIETVVGPPEAETPEERQKRHDMIERDARRREALRRAS
jgi:hypothetical protein